MHALQVKDEIMVPFHLALTDEQTDQINRGGYEAWDIYLSDTSMAARERVKKKTVRFISILFLVYSTWFCSIHMQR